MPAEPAESAGPAELAEPAESAPSPRTSHRHVLANIVVVGVVVALGWAGAREWEVPWVIPRVCAEITRWTGWSVEIGRLWVTPWQGARARDIMIHTAAGGRLQAESLEVRYRLPQWLRGTRPSEWRVRAVHIDPGSWKIKRASLATPMAAGAVVDAVSFRLAWRWRHMTVEHLRVRGWLLRCHGAWDWDARGAMRGWIRGQLATLVFRGRTADQVRGRMEPFLLYVDRTKARPTIRFVSPRYTITMKGTSS